MCGVVGIVGKTAVHHTIFDALTVLQHRGQEAAGIATCDQGQIFLKKGLGLVRDVFMSQDMRLLSGNTGIGHIRYPTAGTQSIEEAQPFYVNSPYGIALAHNGNLTNAAKLKNTLLKSRRRHINTRSDSEVLLNVFADALQQVECESISENAIFQAIRMVHEQCEGAYAVVALIAEVGIVGFRDPYGIRPLVYGVREVGQGQEYMIASESVALKTQGFKLLGDVAPGEAIFISTSGELFKQQCIQPKTYSPCIFEYIYFARTDSIIDNISVYQLRVRLGEKLAEKIQREFPKYDIDAVIPIPETSRTAAVPLARKLGVEYREGFVKNHYIGRTFIMPGQAKRKKSVHQKLNAIDAEFKGKNVLLVDDSIVRGTTSLEIIQMAREAGAKKVYFASCAPEVRFPNVYGIDMPAHSELVAHERTVEGVREYIRADKLFFQDLEDLRELGLEANPRMEGFEASIFDGNYIAGNINDDYLGVLAMERES